jgi:hypothetical protein
MAAKLDAWRAGEMSPLQTVYARATSSLHLLQSRNPLVAESWLPSLGQIAMFCAPLGGVRETPDLVINDRGGHPNDI